MFISLLNDPPPRLGQGYPAMGFALKQFRPKRGQRIKFDNRRRGCLQMDNYGWASWSPIMDWKPKRGPFRRISALGYKVKAVRGPFVRRMAP